MKADGRCRQWWQTRTASDPASTRRRRSARIVRWKHRLDIEVSPVGLRRYVTYDHIFRNDRDFQAPPECTIDAFSEVYESLEPAKADAIAALAGLRE